MIGFENVRKEYPGGTLAVEDFSLDVASHESVVLVGTSGSGKTTLMRMVNRMVEATAGRVHIDGDDVASLDPVQLRRSIGYVMQASGLLPHRTVLDNITTVPVLRGSSRREARTRAGELMETVGLDAALGKRYPSQLSGGQQQRVGVARGLAADPNILLMDEPFGAVDPIVRSELQQELLHLQRDLKKTIVFVTHDVDEAFLVGDRVVILRPGGIIAQIGTPQEILAEPADDFVASFVGADRGTRTLHLERVDGRDIVVDADGRAAGVLGPSQGAQSPGALSPDALSAGETPS
ncbi:MAG: ATP-binding cassette domain-containing protein [Brachybacterium sp.]|uniref:ABC transporter ATP-binding protein n=1 Tax=Brachybacterium sp. TaxID=1891286 RepID=UPI002648777F|nr:ATP-binding cassette domain-containing protein [Brachybacterium sp.]MDN5685317.1 ATP-binding cassette domain-containing protein [Brachybacterium sp.]